MISNFKEMNINFGANITGGGGINVTCFDLSPIHPNTFKLLEVTDKGAVVKRDSFFQRFIIKDKGKEGVKLFDIDIGNNLDMQPGEVIQFQHDLNVLTFVATSEKGVLFNGKKPTKLNKRLERKMYPLV